ncbi:chemotaxis protein CheW [Bordetella sp. 15P40C-2]|uniref:chemotaxis protein CheW n=1 Tax=Bordetella sp. 15P40C-2 TaxID=2572246 RepID=UPI001EFFADF0|nr:chemotaxis protein CheW [Bordetella sp. 15P40C-2]
MSMDLADFYGTFFDEAEELLQDMERVLLDLDLADPDVESLNAIFRAAHSIKGGAATFGTFDLLVQTTHRLENVLDEVRNHRLPLTQEAVDVFLRGKDILFDQVAAYRGGSTPEADSANALLDALDRLLTGSSLEAPRADTPAAPVDMAVEHVDDTPPPSSGKRVLVLTFSGVSESDHQLLLGELEMMGELAERPGEPGTFVHALSTDLDADTIRSICAFVINDEQVQIQEQAAQAEAAPQPAAPAPSPEPAPVAPSESQEAPVKVASEPPAPARAKAVPQKDNSTIRVATQRVDHLVNLVGEVVIDQAILIQGCQQLDPIKHASLLQGIEHMSSALRTLQESIMALRMVPMEYAFGRYPRVVRETSAKLGKRIELHTAGGATELDKGLIEKLIDPLTHLIRNSLDHGVETPEVREAKGKNPVGRIDVRAYHEGGRIVVEVADDGAGMNREKILAKAVERGMPVSNSMTNNEVFQLVFAPGFSTAEIVTDVSGRGVGMDVVRRNIQEIGGQIEISSTPDVGTTFRISLPLTLAIMDGMSIQVGEERFVMPLNHIVECLQPQPEQVHCLGKDAHVLHLRGEHLPILKLATLFDIKDATPELEQSILIVVQVGQQRYALAVDQLLGQHQVVVKSLETHYERVAGASGATILGDGSVALILDPATLIDSFQAGC